MIMMVNYSCMVHIWEGEKKEKGCLICILQSKYESVQTTKREAMAQNKTPYHRHWISMLTT